MLSKAESKPSENGNNNNSILQIKNLSKAYYTNGGRSNNNSDFEDKYTVLSNIDLDIKEGEFVTIIGPSGCGKSTLLNRVAGIDKEYGSDAEITFNTGHSNSTTDNNYNNDPSSTHPNQDKILIFQEPALFPWLTNAGNVEFGLKVAKVSRDKKSNS